MAYQDDQFYISKTLKGDLASFGILIKKHEKYAFTLALRILKNPEEAEEATQDAFMKVYHSLNSFEGNSKFTTWLYKIIYHEALRRLRKNKHEWNLIEQSIPHDGVSEEFLDGIETLHESQRKEIIKKGLECLKGNESTVLTLFYLQEQSIKEITEVTI